MAITNFCIIIMNSYLNDVILLPFRLFPQDLLSMKSHVINICWWNVSKLLELLKLAEITAIA